MPPLEALVYYPEKIPRVGLDEEQTREVAGAFASALFVDRDTQVFGVFCGNRRPVLVDAGDGQDFAVSVAMNADFDFQSVKGRQLVPYLLEVQD